MNHWFIKWNEELAWTRSMKLQNDGFQNHQHTTYLFDKNENYDLCFSASVNQIWNTHNQENRARTPFRNSVLRRGNPGFNDPQGTPLLAILVYGKKRVKASAKSVRIKHQWKGLMRVTETYEVIQLNSDSSYDTGARPG
jgi:hypothetical protein